MKNKMTPKTALFITYFLICASPTFANIKDYSQIISSEDYTCTPPIRAYVNDVVLLGGNSTFEEFIDVFPSNYEHYVRMFHTAELDRADNISQWCAGRYLIDHNEMKKVMSHWESLFTKENAVQWYQITLSNLAGPYQIDNYPLLAQTMWNTLDKENLLLQLEALKSLPRSTQKILVNAYDFNPGDVTGESNERFLFTIKGIDTQEQCDDEYCAYLTTLIDERFKTMGDFE